MTEDNNQERKSIFRDLQSAWAEQACKGKAKITALSAETLILRHAAMFLGFVCNI